MEQYEIFKAYRAHVFAYEMTRNFFNLHDNAVFYADHGAGWQNRMSQSPLGDTYESILLAKCV